MVLAAQGVDSGVHPEYRRKGVFTAIRREAVRRAIDAGAVFVYAFPGLLALNANLQLGFRSVAFVPELTRVLDLRRALALTWAYLFGDLAAWWTFHRRGAWTSETKDRIRRLRHSLLLLASFFSSPNLTWSGRRHENENVLYPVDRFDTRFDKLCEKIQKTTAFGLRKEASYLSWRYNCHPSQSYKVFAFEEGDQWVGCLVMRHTGLRSEIAELLVLPERDDVADDLLLAAISQARMDGKVSLNVWATAEHPYYANLRRAGFISPSRLHWLAKRWPALARKFYQVIIFMDHLSSHQQANLSALAKTWQLSMGDSDMV